MGDLSDYLRSCKPGPFKAAPVYSPAGDYLIIYFEDVQHFTDPLTPDVEIIRADADRRIVGVKVHGVRGLIAAAQSADPSAAATWHRHARRMHRIECQCESCRWNGWEPCSEEYPCSVCRGDG